MPHRELVIHLVCEQRADGSVIVSSPDLPLFHVIAPNESAAESYAIDMLTTFIEKNSRPSEFKLRKAESAAAFFQPGKKGDDGRSVPAYVIVESTIG